MHFWFFLWFEARNDEYFLDSNNKKKKRFNSPCFTKLIFIKNVLIMLGKSQIDWKFPNHKKASPSLAHTHTMVKKKCCINDTNSKTEILLQLQIQWNSSPLKYPQLKTGERFHLHSVQCHPHPCFKWHINIYNIRGWKDFWKEKTKKKKVFIDISVCIHITFKIWENFAYHFWVPI